MSERVLNMLGLMRRANALAVGEEKSGAACRAGKAKMLLLAKDASENAKARAEGFLRGRRAQLLALPYTKEEISAHVGLAGCSMAAVTDIGFANALARALAEEYPEEYEKTAEETSRRHARAQQRKKEARAHERNKRIGKRRTNV